MSRRTIALTSARLIERLVIQPGRRGIG
jgi:hypothetical protein